MLIKLTDDQYRSFRAAHTELPVNILDRKLQAGSRGYGKDSSILKFEHTELAPAVWAKLVAYAKTKATEPGWNGVLQKSSVLSSMDKDIGSTKISQLYAMEAAAKAFFLAQASRYWVYIEGEAGMEPYLITDITHEPANRQSRTRALVMIQMRRRTRGGGRRSSADTRTMRWSSEDLTRLRRAKDRWPTVLEILTSAKLYHENDALHAAYDAEEEQFFRYVSMFGEQFVACKQGDRYLASRIVSDGVPNKIVMNDKLEDTEVADTHVQLPVCFWTHKEAAADADAGASDDEMIEDTNEPKNMVAVPLEFSLQVYNLQRHCDQSVYARQIEPYVYNTELRSKLILPEAITYLLDRITADIGTNYEDIISGKTGGVVVIARGQPGVGKSTSAEVYSEAIKRPLYQIQSGQLGTTPKELEEKLDAALKRASSWKAVLQIDECDVYIRARGSDIQQNAIVGVFLRRTEYFNGMLFMTTNRGLDIDSAMLSRSQAVIDYFPPEDEATLELHLKQHLKQSGMKYKDSLPKQLSKALMGISGRSVKEMTKLVSKIKVGESPVLSDYEAALLYQPIPRREIKFYKEHGKVTADVD